MNNPDHETILAIQQTGEVGLKPLYRTLKEPFLAFMQRYTKDDALLQDAYHEAMIAFYEYVLADKYDSKKGSIKTLVYQMGRAYLFNRLKKEQRIKSKLAKDIASEFDRSMVDMVEFKLTPEETHLKEAILRLGTQCQELLNLYFYNNFSIDVIRERMNYKNNNVVSAHKSRCLKNLKAIFQEINHGTKAG